MTGLARIHRYSTAYIIYYGAIPTSAIAGDAPECIYIVTVACEEVIDGDEANNNDSPAHPCYYVSRPIFRINNLLVIGFEPPSLAGVMAYIPTCLYLLFLMRLVH